MQPADDAQFPSELSTAGYENRQRMIERIQRWIDNTQWTLDETADRQQDLDECQRLLQDPATEVESFQDLPSATHNRVTERFHNVTYLAAGAFGIVWSADDQRLGKTVALKVLRPSRSNSAEVCTRFLGEAEAAERLAHEGIVRVLDSGRVGPLLYMACEKADGGTLADWLNRRPDDVNPVDVARFVAQIAAALHHAHTKAILHRDIKPGNVLLQPRGAEAGLSLNDYRPIVTDFGLAKRIADDVANVSLTQDGALIGTAQYMSPEQARGDWSAFNTTSEVFSLGIMLYQLLTGQLPFRGTSDAATRRAIHEQTPVRPRQLRPNIPRDLEAITLQCLQPAIAQRYQSMHELKLDLQRFIAGEPVEASRPSWLKRSASAARKHPIVTSLIVLTVIVNLLSSVGIARAWWSANQARTMESQTASALFGFYVDLAEEVLTGSKPAAEVLRSSLDKTRDDFDKRLSANPGNTVLRHRASMLAHLSSLVSNFFGQTKVSLEYRIQCAGLLHQLFVDKAKFNMEDLRYQRFYSMLSVATYFSSNPTEIENYKDLFTKYSLPTDPQELFTIVRDDITWLAEEFPENADYRESLALTIYYVAQLESDPTVRAQMLQQAMSQSKANWQKHRERPILIKTAIFCASALAAMKLQDKQVDQALQIVRSNAELFDEAFHDILDKSWVQYEYTRMVTTSVDVLEAAGEIKELEEVCDRAVIASEGMITHNPQYTDGRFVLLKFAALKYKLAAQRQDQAMMKDVLKKMRDCYFAIEDPAARKDCTRYIIDLELQGKVTNPDPPAD